jgi:hypothetical protein
MNRSRLLYWCDLRYPRISVAIRSDLCAIQKYPSCFFFSIDAAPS